LAPPRRWRCIEQVDLSIPPGTAVWTVGISALDRIIITVTDGPLTGSSDRYSGPKGPPETAARQRVSGGGVPVEDKGEATVPGVLSGPGADEDGQSRVRHRRDSAEVDDGVAGAPGETFQDGASHG
jgi:hypothetical protein